MFKLFSKDNTVNESSFTNTTAFKLAPHIFFVLGLFIMTLIFVQLISSITDDRSKNISGFLSIMFFAIAFVTGLLISIFIYEHFDYQKYLAGDYFKSLADVYSKISKNMLLSGILVSVALAVLAILHSQGLLTPVLLVLCSLLFFFGTGYSTVLTLLF